MKTHIIKRGVANVFAAPCDFTTLNQPELETQLLLNQSVQILETTPGFVRIMMHDTYTGWVKDCDVCEQPEGSTDLSPHIVTAPFTTVHAGLDLDSEVLMRVSLGTILPAARLDAPADVVGILLTVLPDGRTGFLDGAHCRQTSKLISATTAATPAQLAAEAAVQAKKLVGTPYLWGGSTPSGIDCSGLTQLAYRMQEVTLLRNASMQINDKRFVRLAEISFEDAAFQAGDLLFFHGLTSTRITHVGMALGDDRFIHASPYSGESYVVIEKRKGNRYAGRFVAATRLQTVSSIDVAA